MTGGATVGAGAATGAACTAAYLQRQVGVLLLLPHLQAGQVGVPQHELVFVLEILGHGALDGLAVLLLQREAEGQQKGREVREVALDAAVASGLGGGATRRLTSGGWRVVGSRCTLGTCASSGRSG